jgi:general secretion pathway protein G
VPKSVTFWLLIAAILAVCYAIWPNYGGPGAVEAPETAAMADIKGGLKSAIDQFKEGTGRYPNSLQDLFQQPADVHKWIGPYVEPPQLPIDPWGDPYLYQFPGRHNTNSYDLWSAGPDGKSDTEDDISNW